MKILLFGKNGQVGWELNQTLQSLGEVVALGREEADFSDPETLRDIVRNVNPDVIVNAAAYTAVDRAEEDEVLAMIINADAPSILADEALKLNALLIHYSTDYVFDGQKDGSYLETDSPNPVNVYGHSKLAGERGVESSGCEYLIFRTSWVYASRGRNFMLTILKLLIEKDELSVVADQTGAPTSAQLIAETTAHCLIRSVQEKQAGSFSSGLYHLAASGYTSWHGFATEIMSIARSRSEAPLKVKSINAVTTADYPTPAERPKNSRLNTDKIQSYFGCGMLDWRQGLLICLDEYFES